MAALSLYVFTEVESDQSAAIQSDDRCTLHSCLRWESTPTAALAENQKIKEAFEDRKRRLAFKASRRFQFMPQTNTTAI
jgi:hypothetical protein